MIFKPKQLGRQGLEAEQLVADKKQCRKIGPCGVGEKAMYLNSFYIDRRYYVPFSSITRVFKRIAMSKGGYTGKGIFAAIPYLVVEYDNGMQKQCNFKREEQVDQILSYLQTKKPGLKLHSAEAEKRLAEKARIAKERRNRVVSPEAQAQIADLERAQEYLEQRPQLYQELSAAAKKKRTYDRSNPAYKWAALFITLMGLAALLYGIYALVTHAGFAMYFLLLGLAAIFLFSGAHVLPTAKNNRRFIERQLNEAERAMEDYLALYGTFPVPARYAHPGVLMRMTEVLALERAHTPEEALETVKKDLKALNSSVSVEQEEFDEIMAVKPMFLVHDYE